MMLDNSEASLEINHVLNDMGGYTMNATDFASSMENMRRSGKVGGRGRGIAQPITRDGLEDVRLAAQLNRLQPHAVPIGSLATTENTLSRESESEITAGLRSMGIYGTDCLLNSSRTRRTVLDREDIHVDGNVPVILNGELFHRRYQNAAEDDIGTVTRPTVEPYDPAVPLAVQFSTITEFQQCPTTSEQNARPKSKSINPHRKPTTASKSKKTKWRKVPIEELASNPKPCGRYDNKAPMTPGSIVATQSRYVFGEEGVTYLA